MFEDTPPDLLGDGPSLFGDSETSQTLFDEPAPVAVQNTRLHRTSEGATQAATVAAATGQAAQAQEYEAQAAKLKAQELHAGATKPAAQPAKQTITPAPKVPALRVDMTGGLPAPGVVVKPSSGGFQPSTPADLELSQAYDLDVPAPGLLASIPWWGWALGTVFLVGGTWYGYRRWVRR